MELESFIEEDHCRSPAMEIVDFNKEDHSGSTTRARNLCFDSGQETDEGTEKESLIGTECVSSNKVFDSEYQSNGDKLLLTERIEDDRLPVSHSFLRCRAGSSKSLLASGASHSSGSTESLKVRAEDKPFINNSCKGSCNKLLQNSIEVKLQNLDLACKSDSCSCTQVGETVTSQTDHAAHPETESNLESEGLLQSIHRRTKSLSEIDWHEITRFAQGDLFDPDSSTAKEIKRLIAEGKDELSLAFRLMHSVDLDMVVEEAEKCVQCVISTGWNVVSHCELPQWLRDNDFLWHMHRPQLQSFKECFGSMFRVHTETGNIWTHFFGMILIVIASVVVYLRPVSSLSEFPNGWEEHCVFAAFFIGAFMCLMFSWLYHTCYCHSEKTSRLFSKLDYTGIAFMIMGSFVPCMYYGFYCRYAEKMIYMLSVTVLGVASIIVSLWDKFATPRYRPVRAGVFLALGCSAFIPCIHLCFLYGFMKGVEQAALGWLLLMGIMYIVGALLYAMRVPERFFPGKCNIYFQSHQIFHVLVVVAAFIHLHGCCQMALYRIRQGRVCPGAIVTGLEVDLLNSTVAAYTSTLEVATQLM